MDVRSLEDLTELDRLIIVALQQNGRASWTSIAETIGSSVPTVTRRGQQLLASGVVKVAATPAIGSNGPSDMFIVRVNCQPGTQLAVAQQLIAREDVRFLSLVTGKYDIVAEVMVLGGAAHYPQLISQLQSVQGLERWRSDLLMHVYKVGHDWSRQLFARTMRETEGADHRLVAAEPVMCEPGHFDDADRDILAMLRDDGRTTFNSVARDLGLNESSVRRRFDRMRQSGCVDILTLVPAPALGMGAETLLTVRIEPHLLESVARDLARYSAVRYLAATLDNNSLFCEVITGSNDELYAFITATLSRLDGVQGWEASMELVSLKRGFIETPWWRRQVS